MVLNSTMHNQYYTILIIFKAKPGQEKSFKEFLTSIVKIASQSPGCISHDLHQSVKDSSKFMFYEHWVNQEAHEAHIARPEVQEWRSKLNDFLEIPYEVSFWEKMPTPNKQKSSGSDLSELLNIYTPDPNIVLGQHSADFAAALSASSTATASSNTEITIHEMRASVAESLKGKALSYPNGMTQNSFSEEEIGGLHCYILKNKNPSSVPTLVMFYGGGFCLNTMNAHKAFTVNRFFEKLPADKISPLRKQFNEDAKQYHLTTAELNQRFAEIAQFRVNTYQFLNQYDIIICPPCATTAKLHGHCLNEIKDFTYAMSFNNTGSPAVVVPFGTSQDGLPIGVQIVANLWKDHAALAVAKALEAHYMEEGDSDGKINR